MAEGHVRSALQLRWQEYATRTSACAWTGAGHERDVHGGGTDLVLERIRRGDADARARQLCGSAPRREHRTQPRPGHIEAAGVARVPAQSPHTADAGLVLR